ncbi:MAG: hypothetical protein ABSE56_02420 [Bryobacteraceae bacterium]
MRPDPVQRRAHQPCREGGVWDAQDVEASGAPTGEAGFGVFDDQRISRAEKAGGDQVRTRRRLGPPDVAAADKGVETSADLEMIEDGLNFSSVA